MIQPPRDTPAHYTPTVDDLSTYGYARSYPGHWLRPNGLGIVSEQDALRELAEQLNNQQGAS